MIISTTLFCSVAALYISGIGGVAVYLHKLTSEKCNRSELEDFKKEVINDLDKIRDNIQQIYGATKENKATLDANRDTLKLILERLPAR